MPNRRVPLVVAIVAVAAVAAGVWAYRQQGASAAGQASAAVQSFYRQNLSDADGVVQAMASHRGKPVVVNFWATWCVPCVKEIPSFSKVHTDAGGRVAFVGLGIDSPDNIAAFNKRFKPSYPLLAAGATGTELARAFGDESAALPFTVLIGPDGEVVASHLGQVDEAKLRGWLAPFLSGPRAPS